MIESRVRTCAWYGRWIKSVFGWNLYLSDVCTRVGEHYRRVLNASIQVSIFSISSRLCYRANPFLFECLLPAAYTSCDTTIIRRYPYREKVFCRSLREQSMGRFSSKERSPSHVSPDVKIGVVEQACVRYLRIQLKTTTTFPTVSTAVEFCEESEAMFQPNAKGRRHLGRADHHVSRPDSDPPALRPTSPPSNAASPPCQLPTSP